MARRLLLVYVAVVLGPLALGAALFTLRDLLGRRRPAAEGNGHAETEALEHTVAEVPAD